MMQLCLSSSLNHSLSFFFFNFLLLCGFSSHLAKRGMLYFDLASQRDGVVYLTDT